MKIFICWSGELSKLVARAVQWLIPAVFKNELTVNFSPEIKKGAFWSEELGKMLEESAAGIVCFTPENLQNPWIHYEAGLIASRIAAARKERSGKDAATEGNIPIYPLLHQLEPAQLAGPLAAYQSTTTQQADIVRLIGAIAQQKPSIAAKAEDYAKRLTEKRKSKKTSIYEEFREKIEPDIPITEIVKNFAEAFQRKTFDEPTQQCMGQGWRQRYDGIMQTRNLLERHLPGIRAASAWHQRELAELLGRALDYYADATAALLKHSPDFLLGTSGELTMDLGIQTACETRRLYVKAVVSRILNLVREKPRIKDAVRYFGAETFEERKLLVHRLEDRVRRHWFSKEAGRTEVERAEGLRFDKAALTAYRGSSWELERIFYHLNVDYFPKSKVERAECAIRDVELEMERVTARPGLASMMAVGYALGAVRSLIKQFSTRETEWLSSVLKDVAEHIERDADHHDPGGRLRQLIQSIEQALGRRKQTDSPLQANGGRTTRHRRKGRTDANNKRRYTPKNSGF